MEPEPAVVKTTELNDEVPTPATRSKNCIVAWSAIGLLLATWLCLLLGFAFFWKKNHAAQINNTANLTQLQTQVAQNQKNLSQVQAVIQKNFSADNNLIHLKEARELVQLADYNLVYLHDPNTALAALNSANKQLAELNNAPIALETVRGSLNENIAKLKALPPLNLNNALAQLRRLQVQVAALPLLSAAPATKEAADPQPQATNAGKKWVNAIQTSLHSFQQLIVIRHLDKPVEPLLPEIQQQYLQQNLQLLLQQAQWSLIQHQQDIYQSSLQQAKEAVQHYFAGKSPAAQSIVQQLDELAEINLQVALPDLNQSLETIDSAIKTVASKARDQKENPL